MPATKRRRRTPPTFHYHVYFTDQPSRYFAIFARNRQQAVLRAKRVHRGLSVFKRRTPLVVLKIERI